MLNNFYELFWKSEGRLSPPIPRLVKTRNQSENFSQNFVTIAGKKLLYYGSLVSLANGADRVEF